MEGNRVVVNAITEGSRSQHFVKYLFHRRIFDIDGDRRKFLCLFIVVDKIHSALFMQSIKENFHCCILKPERHPLAVRLGESQEWNHPTYEQEHDNLSLSHDVDYFKLLININRSVFKHDAQFCRLADGFQDGRQITVAVHVSGEVKIAQLRTVKHHIDIIPM